MAQLPAIYQTAETTMLARVSQAQRLGLFPEKGNADQLALMAKAAIAYGLDPLMSELILYQGKPFITIDGRRRLDDNAGHHPSIRFRILTTEEKEYYVETGALNPGDLAHVCILTTEHGNTIEGFGRVLAKQRDPSQKGGGFIPAVQYTIEMSMKRAEARARRMAYGPAPRPELLDHMVIIEEGDVVEGQLVEQPQPEAAMRSGDAKPESPPKSNVAPAQAKPSVTFCGIHNIRMGKHPTEGICHKLSDGTWCHGEPAVDATSTARGSTTTPSFPDTPLGALQEEVYQAEMEWAAFEQDVLRMDWPEWVRVGGTVDTARARWNRLRAAQ